jgi:hypothetical protein
MIPAGLLISCCSAPSAKGRELEDWLAQTMARFGPKEAVLYRALEEGATDARPDKIWFLSISSQAAVDSRRVAELLAEMRLLGLNPAVFHPRPLPVPSPGAASVF